MPSPFKDQRVAERPGEHLSALATPLDHPELDAVCSVEVLGQAVSDIATADNGDQLRSETGIGKHALTQLGHSIACPHEHDPVACPEYRVATRDGNRILMSGRRDDNTLREIERGDGCIGKRRTLVETDLEQLDASIGKIHRVDGTPRHDDPLNRIRKLAFRPHHPSDSKVSPQAGGARCLLE